MIHIIKNKGLLWASLMLTLMSCNREPRSIKIGSDMCAHCKMTVTDPKFGGELLTSKGKIFIFDDVSCMVAYHKSRKDASSEDQYFFIDFLGEIPFIEAEKAHFLKSETELRSPMGSSIAAFSSLKKIESFMQGKAPGEVLAWADLLK